MPTLRRWSPIVLVALALSSGFAAAAEPASAPAPATPAAAPNAHRFFLSIAEDAAVVRSQWWEGDLVYTDGDLVDWFVARGVVAFQPWKNVEVGGRVGFGSSDGPSGFPDGTGATDLDAWGKYRWSLGGGTEVAAGALLTVPTGDDTAGLGRDAFDVEGFGSIRHAFSKVIAAGHFGFRLNGDGSVGGNAYSGKTQAFFGGGAIVPLSSELSLVGEAVFRSEWADGGDPDYRILGGVNWRVAQGGMLRGSVAIGLSDGAPDLELTAGYAFTF